MWLHTDFTLCRLEHILQVIITQLLITPYGGTFIGYHIDSYRRFICSVVKKKILIILRCMRDVDQEVNPHRLLMCRAQHFVPHPSD